MKAERNSEKNTILGVRNTKLLKKTTQWDLLIEFNRFVPEMKILLILKMKLLQSGKVDYC